MISNNPLKFLTFFPDFENYHLTKDVGMIPFIMQRNHNYQSDILCYKNDDYPYLNKETPGLQLIFIPKNYLFKFPKIARNIYFKEILEFLDSIIYFMKTAKKIDVLQLYHFSLRSLLSGFLFRILNQKGIIHLKLDLDSKILNNYSDDFTYKDVLKIKLETAFMKIISYDIISVETKIMYDFLCNRHILFKKFKSHIHYMPNGIDIVDKRYTSHMEFSKKENIILHIGRLGSYQKGTEIILEAFSNIANKYPTWKLVLIGKMEKDFQTYYDGFINSHPEIANSILYIGYLPSRDSIYDYYRRSKILAFPSRHESFGLVLIESAIFGTVILGSDLPSTREITDNGNLGYLCKIDDVRCFQNQLESLLSTNSPNINQFLEIKRYILTNYDWNTICDQLNQVLLGESQ